MLLSEKTAIEIVDKFSKTKDIDEFVENLSEEFWHFGKCYNRPKLVEFLSRELKNRNLSIE